MIEVLEFIENVTLDYTREDDFIFECYNEYDYNVITYEYFDKTLHKLLNSEIIVDSEEDREFLITMQDISYLDRIVSKKKLHDNTIKYKLKISF